MSLPATPHKGDALVDRLYELESAKRDALLAFDPDGYEASTAEQARLVAAGIPDASDVSRKRVVALAELMRLNFALLLNLIAISPHFALAEQGYAALGSSAPEARRLRMEG